MGHERRGADVKRLWAISSVFAAVALVGCATMVAEENAKRGENASEAVKKRAAFELPCETEIAVTELNAFTPQNRGYAGTFGAAGCGKRAVYVVECNGFTNTCIAVLNSETTSAPSEGAPP
jgi:hypothetical protein